MTTPVSTKLGLRAGARAILVDAPPGMATALGAEGFEFAARLTGAFDFIQYFAASPARLDTKFPKLKAHLSPRGSLWIAWRKGGRGEDLTLQKIIAIGYPHGLVESKTISVDATWSAIKFTFPKPGKAYANSYGRLPGQD